MEKIKNGFTLIELLILIGILGLLATALIATINPFEQVKKVQDSNVQNAMVEFDGSIVRYYTTHNQLPWQSNVVCQNEIGGGNTLDKLPNCLAEIISDGELKHGFSNADNTLNKIYVTNCGNEVITCHKPQSLSQKHDSKTKYNSKGAPKIGCPSLDNSSDDCYWCTNENKCEPIDPGDDTDGGTGGGDSGGGGGSGGLPLSTPTPILEPTSTPTPAATPAASLSFVGYCGVRNPNVQPPGAYAWAQPALVAPDLATGYARVKKIDAAPVSEYTHNTFLPVVSQLWNLCTASVMQDVIKSYCSINSNPFYWEVIVYQANGGYFGNGNNPLNLSLNSCPSPSPTPTPAATGSANFVPGYALDDTKFFQTYAVLSFTDPGFPPNWMVDVSFRPDFGGTSRTGFGYFGPTISYPVNVDTIFGVAYAGDGNFGTSTSPSYTAQLKLSSKHFAFISMPYLWTQYINGCGKNIYWRLVSFPIKGSVGPGYTSKVDCTTKVGVSGTYPSTDYNKDGVIDWTDYIIAALTTKIRAGGWQPPE
jgi:prepilin-type N-terminal cleavage/methylation domain-containing protein